MVESVCTVIGCHLYVLRNGFAESYILKFKSREAAKAYAIGTRMERVKPSLFIRLLEDDTEQLAHSA